MVKNPLANAGDVGLIPRSGRSPGEGNDNPLQGSCLGKSHGRKNLVGYSPWSRKESDTTERFHFLSFFFYLAGWLNSNQMEMSSRYQRSVLFWQRRLGNC